MKERKRFRNKSMTTKISLLSRLIMALLLGTALTVAAIDFSVPAIPDSLTNIQKDIDKASARTPTPAPLGSSKVTPTSTQWTKKAGDAQGRFPVDFGATKSPAPAAKPQTQTSHTSKTTKNCKVMPDNDDQAKKHKNQ